MDVKPLILIIERDDEFVATVRASFEADGYTVLSAAERKQTLSLFYRTHPNFVFLGLGSPPNEGWELLKRLRELSDVPIILFLESHQAAEATHGFALGADACLMKPFELARLKDRVDVLQRRQLAILKAVTKGTGSLVTPLQCLRLNQVLQIDAALCELGTTGELRLIKQRGYLRAIEKVADESRAAEQTTQPIV
jgi:DNA-binding response OmpR family regulator